MAKKILQKKTTSTNVKKTSVKKVVVEAKSKASTKESSKSKKSTAKKVVVSVKSSNKSKTSVKIGFSNKKSSAKVADKKPHITVSACKTAETVVVAEEPIVVEPQVITHKFTDELRMHDSNRPSHHIAFSLEDLEAYFKDRANNIQPKLSKKEVVSEKKKTQPKKVSKGVVKLENKSQGVATIFDLLGFNPVETPSIEKLESKDVPRKWKKYYNKLVELREHHSEGVSSRSEEVMKRSAKDDAGDLSSNGQHLADAGSASFERDLAYNMISNQTEVLAEIEAAIKRIKDGTYGVCEVTGKPIPEARLEAIPFARFTKEGQEIHELEQKRVKSIRRESIFDLGMDTTTSPQQKSDDDDIDTGM